MSLSQSATSLQSLHLNIKKQMKKVYWKQAQSNQMLHKVFHTTEKLKTPLSIPEIGLIKYNNLTCET
jgi:hypothetical protein